MDGVEIHECYMNSTHFNIIAEMVFMNDDLGVWTCICGFYDDDTAIIKYGRLCRKRVLNGIEWRNEWHVNPGFTPRGIRSYHI